MSDCNSYSEFLVNEASTAIVRITFRDEDGDPIHLAEVDAITLTLVDVATGTILNGRDAQNALNANDCTFDATSGVLTWDLRIEDTTLVSEDLGPGELEQHLATFTLQWDTTKQVHAEVMLNVRNLLSVPQGGSGE